MKPDLDPRLIDKVLRRVLDHVASEEATLLTVGIIRAQALEDAASASPSVRLDYMRDTDTALRWLLDEALIDNPVATFTPGTPEK